MISKVNTMQNKEYEGISIHLVILGMCYEQPGFFYGHLVKKLIVSVIIEHIINGHR